MGHIKIQNFQLIIMSKDRGNPAASESNEKDAVSSFLVLYNEKDKNNKY